MNWFAFFLAATSPTCCYFYHLPSFSANGSCHCWYTSGGFFASRSYTGHHEAYKKDTLILPRLLPEGYENPLLNINSII